MKIFKQIIFLKDQSGAVAPLTAIMFVMFLGFVALAIDIGHLVVTKNELQNAADAGALAGAKMLYNDTGTAIQDGDIYDKDGIPIAEHGANEIAYETAITNNSEKKSVEVIWTPGADDNTHDVQRGHWSFATGTFTENASTTLIDMVGQSTSDLDTNPNFINAVQVTARRDTFPITSFFAGILGFSSFKQSATAVAWVGYSGRFVKGEFDIPIALCEEMLKDDNGKYICDRAVMYEQVETAMWTNMSQPESPDDACNSADANEVKDLIGGVSPPLRLGVDMGVNNGLIDKAVSEMIKEWQDNVGENPDHPWRVKVPVVKCFDREDPEVEENTCAELVGGVEVDIIWITDKENKSALALVPDVYYSLDQDGNKTKDPVFDVRDVDPPLSDEDRWNQFAETMGLVKDPTASPLEPLPLNKDNFYFKASCDPMEPSGGPGGENFGMLARFPVLVN